MILPTRLETPAFTMRPWSVEDAGSLRKTLEASDAHLRAWVPWVVDGRVPGTSLEDRLQKHAADFAAGTEWVYGMISPDGTEVLGGCGLYPRIGPRAIELGYWLSVARTGRGLATQAARVLTRLAFADAGIDRVEIRCAPGNVASAGVPRRLGYALENRSADAAGTDGLMIWQITRPQFAELDAVTTP